MTEALSQKDFHEYNMHALDLKYVTMTNYDDNFKNIDVIFNKENLNETLGEVLEAHGKHNFQLQKRKISTCYFFLFRG